MSAVSLAPPDNKMPRRQTHLREEARRATETRGHPRLAVHSLAYIELSDENAGLILNISETGISVQAVQTLNSSYFPHMRFRLPGTEIPVEVAGKIVWQVKSKKEAGIEFVDPPGEVRTQIAQWIAEEPSRVAAAMARANGPGEPPPEITGSRLPAEPESAANHKAPPAIPPVPTTPAPSPLPDSRSKEAPSVPHVAAPSSSAPSPQPGYASRSGDRPEKAGDARPTHGQRRNRWPAVAPSEGSWPHRKLTPSTEQPDWTSQDRRSESRTPDTPPEFDNNRTFPDEQGPERISAMPQWHGYVAPGVGMEFRKPRQWWTYTAALALFLALGFAALMMFNPDAITRAIEALTHQTSSTRNDAQAANPGPARNPTATTNASPPPASPSPSSSSTAPSSTSSDSEGLNAQAPAVQQEIPEVAGSSPSTNPTRPGATQNERERSANRGVSQGTQNSSARSSKVAPHDRPAKVPAPTGQAKHYAYRFGGQPQGSRVAEAPVNSDYWPAGATYSQQGSSTSSSPAANSRGTYASQGSFSQRSLSPSAQPGSPPSTQPPPSTSAAGNFPSNQPTAKATGAYASRPVQQRDQDAYARYSSNLPATSNTASRSISQSQISTIQVPSSRIYPVPPSVPLVGVPSGSVAATSELHAIRVSSELQKQSSQLVGNLQIGELVSSYSPAYPIGAAREGIEGTVRLDVVVARDGTVRSVQIMSGPPTLASSAANAVRDWRYGETFLSGQAIETEQYVTIVFRLAK